MGPQTWTPRVPYMLLPNIYQPNRIMLTVGVIKTLYLVMAWLKI